MAQKASAVMPATESATVKVEFHRGQRDMLTSWARITAAVAGIGGGKTTAGYMWLWTRMKKFPGYGHLVAFPDWPLLSRIIFQNPDPNRPTLIEFLQTMGEEPQLHMGDRYIECRSGNVFFASAERISGWQGGHMLTAWLDEFDDQPETALDTALQRTQMYQGYVLLTGTPRNVAWVKRRIHTVWRGTANLEAGEQPNGDVWTPETPSGMIRYINFPSTANPRYDAQALERERATMPAWQFARYYLGMLADAESGGAVPRSWWRWTDRPMNEIVDECTVVLQVWDTASKVRESASFTVCATWGLWGHDFVVLDVWRDRVQYPELKSVSQRLAAAWRATLIVVEDTSNGIALGQELRDTTSLPVINVQVKGDKLERLQHVSPYIYAGRVWLPTGARWVHEFVDEHSQFPSMNEHDDQVDTTSLALRHFHEGAVGPLPQPEEGDAAISPWTGMGASVAERQASVEPVLDGEGDDLGAPGFGRWW